MSSNGNPMQMVRTTMAIPIDIGGGQVAKINLPPGATLAGPVKVLTLPNQQTIAHVTVMAPPGVVEKYVAKAAEDSEQSAAVFPKTSTPATTTKPEPSQPVKPPSTVSKPPPVPEPSVKSPVRSPVKSPIKETSAPSNLFDKLTVPKLVSNKTAKSVVDNKPVLNKRSKISSSSSDDLPLSVLSKKSEPPPENIPIKKKLKPPPEANSKPKEKKPQTGFMAYVEEMRSVVLEENPHYSDKEITRDVRELWEALDVSTKNCYIRNSDAYKLKKSLKTKEDSTKKRIPKKSKPSVTPKAVSKPSSTPETVPKPSSTSKTASSTPKTTSSTSVTVSKPGINTPSGYNYPKRNVKRKHFDVSDHEDDENDEDWKLPVVEEKPAPQNHVIPSAMPPLKFKKKSRDIAKDHQTEKVLRNPVNDDEELPAMLEDEKSVIPSTLTLKNNLSKTSDLNLIKESTPPPPLRKIETVSQPSAEPRKANFKPICLHEGCYEEAQTTDDRGKYWCSNKCCILYSKIIFNAWIGARKANMIE